MNAEQALQMSEEILTLMREDGVKDSQLIKAYRDCSRFSVENGDSVKAVNYAEKELEVESFSIGERRTRSKDDFESAKNWLDTLKVLRGQQRYREERDRPKSQVKCWDIGTVTPGRCTPRLKLCFATYTK